VFPSSSKIRAIYAFVRDSLREDVKSVKFILCMYLSRRRRLYTFIHPLYPSRRVYWFGLETHRKPIASNPPPRDLKVSDPTVRDLTLGELGLSPSSILHFRFVDDGLNRAFLVFFLYFRFFSGPRVVDRGCPALTSPRLPPPLKKRSGLISFVCLKRH
jgi:hypothetical protein